MHMITKPHRTASDAILREQKRLETIKERQKQISDLMQQIQLGRVTGMMEEKTRHEIARMEEEINTELIEQNPDLDFTYVYVMQRK